MDEQVVDFVLSALGASSVREVSLIQSLWSGYGTISRYNLEGGERSSVVVKAVSLEGANHPRGWNTSLSHQRKLKSYEVETAWYEKYASACGENCQVPKCLASTKIDGQVVLVLEDVDAIGYARRVQQVAEVEVKAVLSWLANFHATYLQQQPVGLWAVGTYWHLETRPDELDVLADKTLKSYASAIDARLNAAKYQTFVHGDAKLANFCFSDDGSKVAAVDFQYVGGGCGMKDVAYFLGSCLGEADCESMEETLLNFYFDELAGAIRQNDAQIDIYALIVEWRELYKYAWTDFHRFLKGWSPGHWKINSYSERLSQEVIRTLKNTTHGIDK